MKRKELEEFFDMSVNEMCKVFGRGSERCPNIDIALCDDLDCFPPDNDRCWKKFFDENLEG